VQRLQQERTTAAGAATDTAGGDGGGGAAATEEVERLRASITELRELVRYQCKEKEVSV
jgi:hypothetical protein